MENEKLSELSEEDVIKILETPPREIKETNIMNDIHLSKEDRLKHARELLDKWKRRK